MIEAYAQPLGVRLSGEAENGDELVPADDDERARLMQPDAGEGRACQLRGIAIRACGERNRNRDERRRPGTDPAPVSRGGERAVRWQRASQQLLEEIAALLADRRGGMLAILGVGPTGVGRREVHVAHQLRGQLQHELVVGAGPLGVRDDCVPQHLLRDPVSAQVVLQGEARSRSTHRSAALEGQLLSPRQARFDQRAQQDGVVAPELVEDLLVEWLTPVRVRRQVSAQRRERRAGKRVEVAQQRTQEALALSGPPVRRLLVALVQRGDTGRPGAPATLTGAPTAAIASAALGDHAWADGAHGRGTAVTTSPARRGRRRRAVPRS